MLFNSPISTEKVNQLIRTLKLNADSKVVDFGCGEGEFLIRVHEASKADCLGIDLDLSCIERAENKLKSSTSSRGSKLKFLLGDVQNLELENNSFDVAICMGSSHAFGLGNEAYPNALKRMCEILKPNGLILIGEGYWKRKPDQEYLDFIGEPVGIYNSHEQNIQQAESLGLVPFYAVVSNQDEWDHFEWSFRNKMERKVITDPDNLENKEKLKSIREWNKYYRKFGRTTMGFGFYIYLKPHEFNL